MTTTLSGTVRVAADGTVTRGIDVPHLAVNIKCHAVLFDGTLCPKRAGHAFRKDEERHLQVDERIVASPPRVVHGRRFAPHGIPKGVDLNITLPHNCENHLDS